MDGVQLPQGYSHFEEAVYFLPFISQKFLILILLTSEGWKAELTLEPPSGFEHGTPGMDILIFDTHLQLSTRISPYNSMLPHFSKGRLFSSEKTCDIEC